MSRKRKNVVLLYLNDEEIDLLDERVKESNYKNRNEFLRKGIIKSGNVFIINTDEIFHELQEVSAQISRVGNTINQIAKRINSTNDIYYRDMLDIKEKQEEIWQILKRDISAISKLEQVV